MSDIKDALAALNELHAPFSDHEAELRQTIRQALESDDTAPPEVPK